MDTLQTLARRVTLARALAAVGLLYVLNAFIRSGAISPLEFLIGTAWIGFGLLLGGLLRVWMILALGFCLSLAWAFYVDSQPISDFLGFHREARAVVDTGNVLAALDSKSPPTVAYYALFQAVRDGYPSNYVAGAVAWTAGAYLIYRSVATILGNAWHRIPSVGDGLVASRVAPSRAKKSAHRAGDRVSWRARLRRLYVPSPTTQRAAYWRPDHAKSMSPFLARFICAALVLYPSFIAAAAVPSSEAVYFLLTGIGVWALTQAVAAEGVRCVAYAALTGLVIGCLYLTRMNALVLLLPCGFVLVAWGRNGTREIAPALAVLGSLAAGLAVVVIAFACLSAVKGDGFSIRPSPHGELNLLFGTNRSTKGGFSPMDKMLAGHASEDPEVRAGAPAKALELAWARIRDDPIGFAWFAVTDKVGQLWGREHAVIGRSIGPPENHQLVDYHVLIGVLKTADGAYRITLLLFLAGLAAHVVRPDRTLILGSVVLLYALPHLLVEVQPRYHLTMVPYVLAAVCVFLHQAAASFVGFWGRWTGEHRGRRGS